MRNEEETLPTLIDRIDKTLDPIHSIEKEIIIINDNSNDNTGLIASSIQESREDIKIFTTYRRYGVHPCLLFGIKKSTGDWVTYFDCDLQDPPELLPKMIKLAVQDKVDVVNTVRTSRKGENFLKMFITRLTYKLINFLSDVPIVPNAGDFKLLSRRAVEALLLDIDNEPYLKGATARIGYKQAYIPYSRDARYAGEKKYSLFSSLNPYRELFRAVTLHSDIPLLFSSFLSLLGVSMGIIIIPLVLYWRITGLIPIGFTLPLLILSLMSIFIMSTMVISSIYLSRIMVETRNKNNVFAEYSKGNY